MRKYFPKPKYSGGCVKGELDWSNYAKKKQQKKQILKGQQVLIHQNLIKSLI